MKRKTYLLAASLALLAAGKASAITIPGPIWPGYTAEFLAKHDLNGDGVTDRYDICWWQWELMFANEATQARWAIERDFNNDGMYSRMDILAFSAKLVYVTDRVADAGHIETVLVRGIVPGDANGDGRITTRDWDIVAGSTPVGNSPHDWISGDWNSDGVHDGEDVGLAWWFEGWDTAVTITAGDALNE